MTTSTPKTFINVNSNKYIVRGGIGVAIFLLLAVIYIAYKKNQTTAEIHQTPPVYTKKDFKNVIPNDFLQNIPLPKDVTLEQSYGLQYASKTQSTIVFKSPKTVKENYTLYENFLLEKQEWWFSDKMKVQTQKLSSIYSHGVTHDINITITEITDQATTTSNKPLLSQVSISLLKR